MRNSEMKKCLKEKKKQMSVKYLKKIPKNLEKILNLSRNFLKSNKMEKCCEVSGEKW